jgi:pimeloyl-ACP methyl ester carboxylesterase
MAARPDRTAVFESFPGSRLVLHGEADQLIPVAEAAVAGSRSAAIHRVLLPGIGHMPMWEAAPKTVDALGAWARSGQGR